jgi:polysaccharide chain length determinant protein (PEP-CTERM system associated)
MKDLLTQVLGYLSAVYRYRYLFVFVSLSVMTAVGIYSFNLPKKYQADTTVFIESNVIDELVQGIAITPNIEDRVRVLQFAILSRDMIEKTLEAIDSKVFTKPSSVQQAYITGLAERTRINVTSRMDRFTVSIVDQDPLFAQQFVNTLVGLYVEENLSAKRDETYGANRFLQEQIETFKLKLEAAEDKIIEFRKQKGVYFSVDESATLANIRDLQHQVEEIDLTLETQSARRTQLQRQLDQTAQTVDIVSETAENNRLAILENQLANLLLRYTDNYPEVIRLRSELETLKQRMLQPNGAENDRETSRMTSQNPLYQELQGQLYDVEAELSSLAARKRNLVQTISKRETELHEVPAAQKELRILTQERDSYRSIYDELLDRMGQSEVSKQMEIGNKASTFRIVDPAILPETPISPNMLRMLLLSLVVGLGSGFGLVFLLDSMDTRIRSVATLKDFGVDVLAVVPNISDPNLVRAQVHKNIRLFTAAILYVCCFIGISSYFIFFT